MLEIFIKTHNKFTNEYDFIKNPEILYCAFYQDGVMHAYERILALRNTGRYSCYCEFDSTFKIYEKLRKEKVKIRQYEDVAYIDGYLHAHLQLFCYSQEPDSTPALPLFYAYGCKDDIVTAEGFKKILKEIPNMHKGAYVNAKRIAKKHLNNEAGIMHHPAYL